ncbi:uncharacterized protein LOC120352460 [Nilaparvata lugens]|uniref:uncharacterized protein LOC120352460 n=1 Tax=Nilaparvata lugens TaxID=108931 RepID=UPI00193DCF3A|nr:uncharacterized protein LOC120352460 [Nilaparvata lugens]XP_039289000.1 uncharacterized protein LOC120352460 [Nilaparvata lugens]
MMVIFDVGNLVSPSKFGLFHIGVLVLLLVIDLRPAKPDKKDVQRQSSEQYDPYKINFDREFNLENKSDSIRSNDWKPIIHNETSYRRLYLRRVNVFESQKITNKTDSRQNLTEDTQDKKLPNLFRTLRLANVGKGVDSLPDNEEDDLRQKKRYRHSKRVRIIKPPHFLVPPQKNHQSSALENEARQFYRVYQTKYMKTPGYQSSEESSREDGNKDASKRTPKNRVKKIRRRPTNYLKPPVITLTTTEHIFFVRPKETTPMSVLDDYSPGNDEEIYGTTERNFQSVTGSLDESLNFNTTKPIKYRVIHSTTTEVNSINQSSQTLSPVDNISSDSPSTFAPRTYNFANSPVIVYSENDIFGLGEVSTNGMRWKHEKNEVNEERLYRDMVENNKSGRGGRHYDDQSRSIESGGVYVADPPNFNNDKEDSWSPTIFRGSSGSASYGGSGTLSTAYQGSEITTIKYRSPETSGDSPGLTTGRSYVGSQNTTNYSGSNTSPNYRGSDIGRFLGGPETTTSYRGPETVTSYRSSGTVSDYENVKTSGSYDRSPGTTSNFQNPGPTTVYSDQVWKTSSYIPDDSRSGFYITNTYKPTENKLSTLSDMQTGISIQEINDMLPNTTSAIKINLEEEVSAHTESYFEPTKMDKNLMSPEVQKSGMTVSKLDLNHVLNKSGEVLHQWIARFDPNEDNNFKTSGRSFGASKYGGDNSLDYQDLADRQVKLHVAESGHFRKGQFVEKGLLLQQNNVIPGEAGTDYPILSKPPHNSRFMCKADGLRYVADVSSGCQVFYMCVGEGPGEPMLCPNGTLFSQDFLVCDWWYNVECRYKK